MLDKLAIMASMTASSAEAHERLAPAEEFYYFSAER